MKLVTPFKKSIKMAPEYVPGKCNIGARGRAIRLATGLGIIAVFVGLDLLALRLVFAPFDSYWLYPSILDCCQPSKEPCRSAYFTPLGAPMISTSQPVWPLAVLVPKWT